MNASTTLRGTAGELAWWGRGGLLLMRRWPGHSAALVAVVWLSPWVPAAPLWWLTILVVVSLRCWARCAPFSFHRLLAGPVRRSVWRVRLRRSWPALAFACDLARGHRGGRLGDQVERTPLPRVRRVTADGPRVTLHLRPLPGQTVDDFQAAGEPLRMAVGATRVRIDPDGVNLVAVTFTIGDGLATPFAAARPLPGSPCTDSVSMGRCEDGSTWRLPVGPHTLVAGMSGSGKGSVFWSFAFGMASGVRTGMVQLHGVDLKGGMEVLMGADLFTTRATNASEAVVLLERLVRLMRARTAEYAGRVRSHVATIEEPLHVVMVDELAALTAYNPERDLQRRAEMAINLLCSQGRAPGFVVFACLQDPRKEVIPSRGLFTQMVGLRLKDPGETTMVLGDSAVASGAMCHRITRDTPGMGYVVPEDGGYPLRVRAGYVSDTDIRTVAAEFASPSQHLLDVPATASVETRSARRPRPGGAGVA